MNLAVFLNLRFFYDGVNYTAEERYFQFWASFAGWFDKVIMCVPVLETTSKKGIFPVGLNENRVAVCHLPYYASTANLYLRAPAIVRHTKRIIAREIAQWDVVGAGDRSAVARSPGAVRAVADGLRSLQQVAVGRHSCANRDDVA